MKLYFVCAYAFQTKTQSLPCPTPLSARWLGFRLSYNQPNSKNLHLVSCSLLLVLWCGFQPLGLYILWQKLKTKEGGSA